MADELPRGGRVLLGCLSAALGLIPMLGAFDVGLVRRADIHGPPWIAFVAGSIFFLAGLMLMAGERRVETLGAGHVLVFLMISAFAAIGNWIAFGPGTRVCDDGSTGLWCRGPFGIGALMLDGVLVWLACRGLARLLGPGKPASAALGVGKAVLLLGLAPVLVPLLIVLLGKVAFDVVRERIRTGRWPRNEEFLARMRLHKC